ncbi:unnamed protein product [Lathyrus oleraceus]
MLWNYRGVGNKISFVFAKTYIQERYPDMLIIIETRVDPGKLYKSFKNLGFNGFEYTEVMAFSEGIVMGWENEKVNVTILQKHFQFIHSKINTEDGNEWFLTSIYASPREDSRKELWEALNVIVSGVNCGWILVKVLTRIDFSDHHPILISLTDHESRI